MHTANFVPHERAVAAILVGPRTAALDDEVWDDAVERQVVVVAESNRRQEPGPGERCLHGIQLDLNLRPRSISKMALTRLARFSTVGMLADFRWGVSISATLPVHRIKTSAAALATLDRCL